MILNKKLLFVITITAATLAIPSVLAAGETVGTLDKILNFVIPLVMFGLFGALLYKAFKQPIDNMIAWIKESMAARNENKEYQPKYKNGYMFPGDIKYMR